MAKRSLLSGTGQLETRWLYLAPGGSIVTDDNNVDYIIGEDAVIAYVQRLDERSRIESGGQESRTELSVSSAACEASVSHLATSQEDPLSPPTVKHKPDQGRVGATSTPCVREQLVRAGAAASLHT